MSKDINYYLINTESLDEEVSTKLNRLLEKMDKEGCVYGKETEGKYLTLNNSKCADSSYGCEIEKCFLNESLIGKISTFFIKKI